MTTTIIDHRTEYETACDEWACPECGKLMTPPDEPHEDWGEPGYCGVWCEFASRLSGWDKIWAATHIEFQEQMNNSPHGSSAWCDAREACTEIDAWFAAEGVETPEW